MFYRHFGFSTLIKDTGQVRFHEIHHDEYALFFLEIDHFVDLIGVFIIFHLAKIPQYLDFANYLNGQHITIKYISYKLDRNQFAAYTVSSLQYLSKDTGSQQLFKLVPIFNVRPQFRQLFFGKIFFHSYRDFHVFLKNDCRLIILDLTLHLLRKGLF